MSSDVEVAIIGAGPYGLSLAAHLRACGMSFRIFGSPMHTWLKQMPEGMHLKSEGFASTLYDPQSAFTLGHYCLETGKAYAELGLPVPLETFTDYGLEFQKRYVPNLEPRTVLALTRSAKGFRLALDDDSSALARKVILAVGISHYAYLPPFLAELPSELVTHSSRHRKLHNFKGRDVTVMGSGASAVDLAALLRQAGASVRLVARKSTIHFHEPIGKLPRPFRDSVRAPMTGLGPGWRSLFCVKGPVAFRLLPEKFRLEVVRRHLGPAPGWFVKNSVVGHIPMHLGHAPSAVRIENGRVCLELAENGRVATTIQSDHLIAGTGFRVDLRRLAFLKPELLSEISMVNQTPRLSSNFESSIRGLYFVGATAANTFGPLVRFAYGAGFTARRLSRHLTKRRPG